MKTSPASKRFVPLFHRLQESLWQAMAYWTLERSERFQHWRRSRLVQIIQALYEHSCSAVNLNNKIGNFFRKTIDVRQGCIISPILFNLFRERIMQITLQDHVPTISISGRQICNLRLADDINLMGGSNAELQYLTSKALVHMVWK